MKKQKVLILISIASLVSCKNVLSSFDNSSNNNISTNSTSTSLNYSSSFISSNNESSTTNEISSSTNIDGSSSSSTNGNSVSSSNDVINTYTVTWKNYNGDILEEDFEVPYGSIPSYDGETPIRESENNIQYIFSGWSPSISAVIENVIYTAMFNEINNDDVIHKPILSNDNKTIQYGVYPQTYVSDSSLINSLNELDNKNENNWYYFEGNYYVKEIANPFDSNCTFDDNTKIISGNEYWFKCEPIIWDILSNNENSYYLVSSVLLDVKEYYNSFSDREIDNSTVYSNNYEYSNIRFWLNDEFYNSAFCLNNSFIQETYLDNSFGEEYKSKDTNDKVFLPSYNDYLNEEYGFDKDNKLSSTRTTKTTDYARAKGAWYNTEGSLKYNGTYFTRSASSEYSYCAWNVNSGGYLCEYSVDGITHSVRPAITISII